MSLKILFRHSSGTIRRNAPTGAPRHFFSQHGLNVLGSEARLIWLPCLSAALGILLVRLARKIARFTVNPASFSSVISAGTPGLFRKKRSLFR